MYIRIYRDFGYVARDQVTKKHKCHVFRCDMPARAVAKALLENHKMSKSPSLMTSVGKENGQPQGRAGETYMYMYVRENISEPQLPRLQTAPRPRCQPVTHCAGRISACTCTPRAVGSSLIVLFPHVHMYTCIHTVWNRA